MNRFDTIKRNVSNMPQPEYACVEPAVGAEVWFQREDGIVLQGHGIITDIRPNFITINWFRENGSSYAYHYNMINYNFYIRIKNKS